MLKKLALCLHILSSKKYLVATQDENDERSLHTNFEYPEKILYKGSKFYPMIKQGEILSIKMKAIRDMNSN